MIQAFIRGQSLKISSSKIVAGSNDYLELQAIFQTGDWAELDVWAFFSQDGKNIYRIHVENGKITKDQHLNLSEGAWQIYFVGMEVGTGDTKITTETQVLSVQVTGYACGDFPAVPASHAEQITKDAAEAKRLAQQAVDTVTDNLPLTQRAEAAAEASEVSAQRSETAAGSARQAETNAQAARDTAVKAAGAAGSAATAAESAQTAAANSAAASAEGAQAAAGSAASALKSQNAADASESEAKKSAQAAAESEGSVRADADCADGAAKAAAVDAQRAQTAAASAEGAQTAAAKSQTAAARSAEQAQTDALTASEGAKTAREQAEAAVAAADRAEAAAGQTAAGDQRYANAFTRTVTGEVIAVDDVSPLEHDVRCGVIRENLAGSVVFGIYADMDFTVEAAYEPYHSFKCKLSPGVYTLTAKTPILLIRGVIDGIYDRKVRSLPYQFEVKKTGMTGLSFRREDSQPLDGTEEVQLYKGSIDSAPLYTPYIPNLSAVKVKKYGRNIWRGDSSVIIPQAEYAHSMTAKWKDYIKELPRNIPLIWSNTLDVAGTGAAGSLIFNVDGQPVNFVPGKPTKIPEGDNISVVNVYAGQGRPSDSVMSDIMISVLGEPYEPYIPPETYPSDAEGNVAGVTSLSPSMTQIPDTPGVQLTVQYNRDSNAVYAELMELIKNLQNNAVQ